MTALLIISGLSLLAAWGFVLAQAKDHAQSTTGLHQRHAEDLARLHDDRARDLDRLHAEHNRERELWHRERSLLLNRINPATAQYVPSGEVRETPPAVGFDDDQAFWKAKGIDVPTDELADLVMAAELAQQREGHDSG